MRNVVMVVAVVLLATAGCSHKEHPQTIKWIGTGVFLKRADGKILIREVLPNSPAEQAGLLVNDQILDVDDNPVEGMRIPDVLSELRGPADTVVKVTIAREGTPAPVIFSIVRKPVESAAAPSK